MTEEVSLNIYDFPISTWNTFIVASLLEASGFMCLEYQVMSWSLYSFILRRFYGRCVSALVFSE